ncbi:MAG TPA: FAD-dependent oxidoreductase [Steroidobacteraceae bacterium]|nr:FAD-dependent oxidoreductase [Steroidobacteraceae bacterium]
MRTAAQIEAMVPTSDRSAQRFPQLRAEQIEVVRRFAKSEPRRFAAGEALFEVGERGVPAWFLLEGSVELIGRDGLDRQSTLRQLSPGQFTGELNQLSERPALAGARAGTDGCLALPLGAEQLRALIVGSAELGELLMRAFILRRIGLLEQGIGPVLLGRAGSADILRLQSFLSRNTYPHMVLDCASERGRQLINDLALPAEDLPILICPCGRVLKRPTNEAAGAWLGITPSLRTEQVYDVAVIGAGPAGLATAVYAASEGLSVLVLDAEVLGGQAGASARIENYLGFPTGISGQALTGRALNQAQKFGAQVAIPLMATRLRCEQGSSPGSVELTLSEQGAVRARAVVVASGARYKRPEITEVRSFEGDSVHYWASPAEAKLCGGEEIALVGAGNSAGQAAVFLAPQVRRLTMIVRGEGLEASMSRYLIDRIRMLDNVEVLLQSEVTELHGSRPGVLESGTLRNRKSGATRQLPMRHLFMFIGAEPNTAWLDGCLALDSKGYVLTGDSAPGTRTSALLSLQTSLPRVFAIGDVRSGSTKRVASAVGEGAAVVAQIHSMLGAATTSA